MSAKLLSGFGASHSEKSRPYTTIDLAGIRALIDAPVCVDKLQAQWFIPSTLPTRTFKEQEMRGEFWMLWADLDENPPSLEAVADLIGPLECDYEIYTSRSATKELPKCRILIPLARPLSGTRWKFCQEILNDFLEVGGAIPDRSNERCAQLCFLPNRGAYFDSRSVRTGTHLDPESIWANALAKKGEVIARKEEEVRQRREAARARKASFKNGDSPSLIQAFNEAYLIEDILLRADYDQCGNRFRHPLSESGSFSASVKDDRVYTFSTSDPLYSNGQGAHDAFSAYTVLFAQGDVKQALQMAGDQMVFINGESWNSVQRREYFQEQQKEAFANAAESESTAATCDEPFSLDRFTLNGQSAQLEAQMLDDTFILGRIAIYGQSTAIYAPPNAGKTLITLALIVEGIEAGAVDGDKLYYINADDNFKGLVSKLKIAEQYGFKMIAPHFSAFKLDEFCNYLMKLVDGKSARGVVVILDTVKKFTDIMDKRVSTNFGKVIRAFVQAGGSVIMLAHVNKHRNEENKVVAAGTSDLIDDADCAYTLDTAEERQGIYLATFENKKSRGDVELSVAYRFHRHSGQSYEHLLSSVKRITGEELVESNRQKDLQISLEKNRELIHVLRSVMRDGFTLKGDIVKEAVERTGYGKDRFRKILFAHTGDRLGLGHFWTLTVGEKNAHYYRLLDSDDDLLGPDILADSESERIQLRGCSVHSIITLENTPRQRKLENSENWENRTVVHLRVGTP
jgi:hypothetical protein